MMLFHWNSEVLRNYGSGDIIVMAESLEEARTKVYKTFDPFEDGNPFEDPSLIVMDILHDPDLVEELTEKANTLIADLAVLPDIVADGVIAIRGSD